MKNIFLIMAFLLFANVPANITAANDHQTTTQQQKKKAKKQSTKKKSTKAKQQGCTHNGRQLHVGPRGGCYYINGNGNKTYVDRSFCSGC